MAGGPCDVQQVVNLYSGIMRRGRLEYHGLSYSSLALSILSQLFQHFVKASEMVVDRRPVLFATHRLQPKIWLETRPVVFNGTHRGPHAVVQRFGRLGTRPSCGHVVLRCPTSEHGR